MITIVIKQIALFVFLFLIIIIGWRYLYHERTPTQTCNNLLLII